MLLNAAQSCLAQIISSERLPWSSYPLEAAIVWLTDTAKVCFLESSLVWRFKKMGIFYIRPQKTAISKGCSAWTWWPGWLNAAVGTTPGWKETQHWRCTRSWPPFLYRAMMRATINSSWTVFIHSVSQQFIHPSTRRESVPIVCIATETIST